ncbi:MAG: 50S ribosomal protein L32 [Lachnospiraceae bacterium]
MSICPKNKTSKARRDKRRANWKMTAPNLVRMQQIMNTECFRTESAEACGTYNKKEIIPVED